MAAFAHIAQRVWTVMLVTLVPLQALATRRLLAGRRPTPLAAYAATARGLLALGLLTLVIDALGSRIGLHVAAARLQPGSLLAWSAATLAAGIAVSLLVMLARRLARLPLEPHLTALLPRTHAERAAFVGLCLLTGLVEEYVMRGFCLGVLAGATRSLPLAVALVSVSFGLAHAYQGWVTVLRATLLGALLAVPVIHTGALAPSMIAHAGINLFAGAWMLGLAKRWGLA